MAQFFTIHLENPQPRLIRQAANIVREGGVIVYPTDSCYALGCHIGDKAAMEKIQNIRSVDAKHHFTLICRDLSEIATFSKVDNSQFRLLKLATPGSFTFILRATSQVPKRLLYPKRNTIGMRIPDHKLVRVLLEELGEPMVSSTLLLPGDNLPLNDLNEIRERLEKKVDLILDGGSCGIEMTTVVDLTTDSPNIIRQGKGDVRIFGL